MRTLLLILVMAFACQAQVPACGLDSSQNPMIPPNYDTFSAPTVGSYYTDSMSGCRVYRLTDNNANGTGIAADDSTSEPFNENDSLMWFTDAVGGNQLIATGPTFAGSPTGTTVITEGNMPTMAGHTISWSYTSANKFYYAHGTSIFLATINGLPGCVAAVNCTVSTSTVASYASSGGSTGSGYQSISFFDVWDGSASGYLSFVGLNPTTNTLDYDVYNTNTSTTTVWHTSSGSCTGTNPLGSVAGCVHKIQLFADGSIGVGYGTDGAGPETGETWFHGNPLSPTATQIQNVQGHLDPGQDASGAIAFITTRIDSSMGTDPCPSGQWTSSASGGGDTLGYPTDPTNSGGTAVCVAAKDWASEEDSFRGGPSRPWAVISFFDTRNPGPERFSTDPNYMAPACTQANNVLPTSGTCWFPYEGEVLMFRITNNMNAAGAGPLTNIYRMAWARSRSEMNFWNIPNATISRDGRYIAFNSNMAYTAGCSNTTVQTDNGCSDVYVITAPLGGPLLPPSVAPAAAMFVGNVTASGTLIASGITITSGNTKGSGQ